MKKHYYKILFFMGILILPTLIWFTIKVVNPELYAKMTYDVGENRNLTQFPEAQELLLSGSKLDAYYSDRAPFRSSIIDFYKVWNQKIEAPYDTVFMPWVMEKIYGGSSDQEKDISSGAYDSLFGETPQENVVPNVDMSGSEEYTDNNCEHQWNIMSGQEATCTSAGYFELKCPLCGGVKYEIAEAKGHSWDVLYSVEASYTTYGYNECKCNVCEYQERRDFKNKLIDDSYMAPKVVGEGTIIGRYNWLFLYGYGNIPYYRATNILSEEDMQAYLDKLETLQGICDEKGIKLGILFCPNKDQVYSEYMPSYTVEDEYKRTQRFVDYVTENSDIAIAYPLEELKVADRYWQVYYKYDTHWNDMGGYIGLQALYREMGYTVTNPLTLEIEKIPSKTVGDLFALGGLSPENYPADEEYYIHYKEDVGVTSKGTVRVSNIYRSTNDGENQEKIVWLGDSYRVMNIPYLERDFGECVVLHRDYIESVVSDIKEADVIVLSAVERYDSRIFKTVDRLIEILSE